MPTSDSVTATLSPAQQQQWAQDGYLLLRGIIPPATVTGLRALYERVTDRLLAQLEAEGAITSEYKQLPFERRFAAAGRHANKFGRGYRRQVVGREVYDLHRVPALVDVAAALLGADVLGHPIFNARPKLPGQQLTVVPWHQDSSYFGAASARSLILTVWIPLVPVDQNNGCLQVIPGTHREALHEHKVEDREGQFLELDSRVVDESKAVTLPMQPGDALVFTNLTFHRSLPSLSPDIRYLRAGDFPGTSYWPTTGFEWVIRSATRPETTWEDWIAEAQQLTW